MSFWKSKHVLVASLMAPILGIGSFYAVNYLVGERPHAAEPGKSYVLVEKPNCRYNSGICGLKNVDFELTFSYERLDNGLMLLNLKSENPLDGIKLALVKSETDDGLPVEMRPVSNDGLNWSLEIAQPDPERDRLHLVASSNQTLYLGDVAMKFTSLEPRQQ